jgi:hypothetical protein
MQSLREQLAEARVALQNHAAESQLLRHELEMARSYPADDSASTSK